MTTHPTVETFCLHVELLDSDPPIWRQVCLQSDASLEALHRVLSAAMGWSGESNYVIKGQGLLSEPGDSLIYTYAPAQGWLHKVTLESVTLESIDAAQASLPRCTAGEYQCPPEFCQGVWDYVDLLDRLSESDDPEEVDSLWQKVGYDFDPEYFDLATANRRLQDLPS